MKRQTGVLVFLAVLVLFVCGRPLAAQDDFQPGDPAELPNVVLVDPAPGQSWQPYEMAVEGTTTVSPPPAINRPMTAAGVTDYVHYDVLLVMYTNTAAGQMSHDYVEMAKEHVRRTRDYIWRNSHFKLFLNLTFLVIDDYVDESEFINNMSCNWMSPDDFDEDGESPSHDILAHGYVKGQFDSINLLWPRSYHSTISLCPYGGLAWFSGVHWQHLGHTMYTTNLMYPGGESLWIPFNHEFQHSIDGAFHLNGRPEYFHADYPWKRPYRFGDNWHFHAVEMRHWPAYQWLDLVGVWGEYRQAPDLDGDGVPDGGDLPVTEMSLGSSTASNDSESDGVSDLQEAMAGMFNASNLLHGNSDGDVWEDVDDFAPLYPLNDRLVKKQRVLDGNPDGWTLLTDHLQEPAGSFSAAVYGNWIEDMLYLMFEINQPARVHVRIDGLADGFWTGRDNYAIELYPFGDPLRFATVNDCTPEQTNLENHCRYDNDPHYAFPRVIDPAEIGRFQTYDGQNYIVQVAIPADAESGLNPLFPNEIGLDVRFDNVAGVWGRTARSFETDDLVYLRLLTADAAEMDGQINALDNCGYDDGLLPDALVTFTGISGQKYEATSDLDGLYHLWLFEADNPYTLSVSRTGYETRVYEGITVDAVGPNKHEASLRMSAPCISVDPASSSQSVRLGTSGSSTISIVNDGLAATDFSLSINYDGGYMDWLAVSLLDGWVEAGGQAGVTLNYDAGLPGAKPGIFTATLVLTTDDPHSPMGQHVSLEIVDYGLVVVPETDQAGGAAGADVSGRFTLTNMGTVVDTFDVAVRSNWPTVVSFSEVTLVPGEEVEVLLELAIPPGARTGDKETAVMTFTSRSAPDIYGEASFQVTVTESYIFLPVVKRP